MLFNNGTQVKCPDKGHSRAILGSSLVGIRFLTIVPPRGHRRYQAELISKGFMEGVLVYEKVLLLMCFPIGEGDSSFSQDHAARQEAGIFEAELIRGRAFACTPPLLFFTFLLSIGVFVIMPSQILSLRLPHCYEESPIAVWGWAGGFSLPSN